MSNVKGEVQSLKKDRTGLKLNDKWYGGENTLTVNQGDEVALELDQGNPDKFGNPSISTVTILKKATNPYAKGSNGGAANNGNGTYSKGGYGSYPKKEFTPRQQDPDTQSRIARSHAITTAVAHLNGLGKKYSFDEAFNLAEKVKEYTETGKTTNTKASSQAERPAENPFGDE